MAEGINRSGREVSLVGNLQTGIGQGGNPLFSMGIAFKEGDANVIGGDSNRNALTTGST